MDETWILQRFLARDEEGLAAAYTQLGPGLTALAARRRPGNGRGMRE